MGMFVTFLLSCKKDTVSLVNDPDKLEEFLLTIGLAYRDMITMHSTPISAVLPQTLPDYMSVTRSLLTRRIMDVCDSILQLTNEELKRSPLRTNSSPAPSATAPRFVSPETGTTPSPHEGGTDSAQPSVSLTSAIVEGSVPRIRSENSPIILPRPRPRKRKNDAEVGSIDDDLVGSHLFSRSLILIIYCRHLS